VTCPNIFGILLRCNAVNMKTSLFLFFLAIFPGLLIAQEYSDLPTAPPRIDIKKIHFGLYIAPDISWMHPTASKSDDGKYYVRSDGSKAGYVWGLMLDYYFATNYCFATGFDLNTSGGKIATTYNPNQVNSGGASTVLNTNFNYNLKYLDIPFALKLRSDQLNKDGLKIYGQFGLTLAINVSKKANYTVDYNDENGNYQILQGTNEKLTGTLATTPLMLQMNLGGGIEYPIKPKLHFYTGLFFNNSFLPNTVSPKNYDLGYKGSFTDGYVRLNNIALRLGLFF